jgi:hypothetical protein
MVYGWRQPAVKCVRRRPDRQLAACGAGPRDEAARSEAPIAGTNETILAGEDSDDVRANSVDNLRELGCRVLQAPAGAAALRDPPSSTA